MSNSNVGAIVFICILQLVITGGAVVYTIGGSGGLQGLLLVIAFIVPMTGYAIYLAELKGYEVATWCFLAFFFPIVSFVAALGLPDTMQQKHV